MSSSFGSSVFARRCAARSEEHTSELQSRRDLVCRLLLEKKKQHTKLVVRFLAEQVAAASYARLNNPPSVYFASHWSPSKPWPAAARHCDSDSSSPPCSAD